MFTRRLLMCLVGCVALLPTAGFAQESFPDVDPDAYYADSVSWMISEGLTTGTGDGLFRPDDPVTRGETAVFLWRLVGEPSAPTHPFGDVTVGWQDEAIAWMYDADITQGVTPTRFDPGGAVSRGAMATFMWRLAGEPAAADHQFVDVPDPVMQEPVAWMFATGISTGLEPGVYGPDVPVVRGQMAVFLHRLSAVLPEPPTGVAREPVVPTAPASAGVLFFAAPSTPRVGERLEVSGSGFEGDISIAIAGRVVAEATAGPDGAFSEELIVPEGSEGMAEVTAIHNGVEIAGVVVDVRPEAPIAGWWFPFLVILAASAGVFAWWRRQDQGRQEQGHDSPAPPMVDEPTHQEPAPEAGDEPVAHVIEERSGAIEVFPVGLDTVGPIGTLASFGGRAWGTTQSDHEGVNHALVVTAETRGTGWQASADLGPGTIDAIAVRGTEAIAVGARHVPGGAGIVRRPSLWHTTDLQSWLTVELPAPDFEDAVFDGVTAVAETLLLHGRSARGPRVWTGAPGGWSTRDMPGPTDCIAVTDRGVLLFGRDLDRRAPVVLMSTGHDAHLAPVVHPSIAVFDAATVLSVVDFQGGLVAAGFDNLKGTAGVFVSDDGAQWHRSPAEFTVGTGIEAIIPHDDLLIAIGTTRGVASESRGSDLALWSSRDAINWLPIDSGSVGTASRAVASTRLDGGVVLSGLRAIGPAAVEVPATWWLQPSDLLADAPTA